jgi:hypothetical protein
MAMGVVIARPDPACAGPVASDKAAIELVARSLNTRSLVSTPLGFEGETGTRTPL